MRLQLMYLSKPYWKVIHVERSLYWTNHILNKFELLLKFVILMKQFIFSATNPTIIVIGWCHLLLNVKKRINKFNEKNEYYHIKVKWDVKLYILSGDL